MSPEQLRELLAGVQRGDISLEVALQQLKDFPYGDLGFARIDTHRTLRTGLPEVILCQGKQPEQVAAIATRMLGQGVPVLGTRCPPATWEAVAAAIPEAQYHEIARLFVVPPDPASPPRLPAQAPP